jgi:hypothetical protein
MKSDLLSSSHLLILVAGISAPEGHEMGGIQKTLRRANPSSHSLSREQEKLSVILFALDHVVQHVDDVKDQIFKALDQDFHPNASVQDQFQNEFDTLFAALALLRLEIRRALQVPDVTFASLTLTENLRNLLEMSLLIYQDQLGREISAASKVSELKDVKYQLDLVGKMLGDLNTISQWQ